MLRGHVLLTLNFLIFRQLQAWNNLKVKNWGLHIELQHNSDHLFDVTI